MRLFPYRKNGGNEPDAGEPVPSGRVVCAKRAASVLTAVYLACMTAWLVMFIVWLDGTWWLFLLNSFAVYLFLPVPAAVAAAVWTRRPTLIRGAVAICAVWIVLFGQSFIYPMFRSGGDPANDNTITVMTFNVRADNANMDGIEELLKGSGADLIALQELTPPVSELVERELADEYPYMLLEPWPLGNSSGIISRYPVRRSPVKAPGDWISNPGIVIFEFGGRDVTVANIHFWANRVGRWRDLKEMSGSIRQRERQTEAIRGFAAAFEQPLIVVGDLNATPMSRAYNILTRELTDSWAKVGAGAGHTFPGEPRPTVLGMTLPRWLIRIDYVFCSDHWTPTSAKVGPWIEGSDHRAVTATLHLDDTQ